MILPGGERIGDVAFPLMQQFEPEYRCLYPSYPPFSTMGALVDGLAALLDRLSIEQVILLAASFGGDVGQCFVRKYPDRVSKLILLNTGIPDERLGRATQVHTFHQAGHTPFLSQPDEFYPGPMPCPVRTKSRTGSRPAA